MQLDWTTFLLQVLNFLVLVWLLKRFLYRPVLDVIARRRADIERTMADAQAVAARANAMREDYEARLTELDRSRSEQLARLTDEIAAERARRMTRLDAECAAERERRDAIVQKTAAETAHKLEAKTRSEALHFAALLLNRLRGPELDERLVEVFIEDLQVLPAEQLAGLRAAAAPTDAALELTTARALGPAAIERLKATLAAQLGRDLPLRSALDPALQSGLRVAIGPWLLAASLADELAFFRDGARRDE
ncbi:MAG: F0F1 ATP synthase subunit delta [Thauera sp.]